MILAAMDEASGWVGIAAAFTAWALLHFCFKITRTVARERTRREIAAYIAEGSMSPDQGERLMAAGERTRREC